MSNQTNHEKIKVIINTIESKTADGGYIYRGERKLHKERPYYGKVSSNLWREYRIDHENFDIEGIQKESLNAAKKHIGQLPQDYRVDYTASEDTDEANDFEILTDIQHYEGKTNLIDFTTDYFIALFFACDGSPNEEGRVILQKTDLIKNWIKYPQNPRHRVIAQKSVFVRPPRGFIEPQEDDIVIIPANQKQSILQHLRKFHGISTETIYNDLHGFIRNQDIHGDVYTHFYRGVAYGNRGDEATDIKEKQKEYEKAITHYTKAIELNPNFAEAHCNRGLVYANKDDLNSAIQDFNTAIELNPNFVEAYYNRGFAYNKGDFDTAIKDFDTAIHLNPNYMEAYNNRGFVYNSKGDFDTAIKDFDTAIHLNPNYMEAYNNRGFVYNSKGDFDTAIKDYQKAIELDPNFTKARNNLKIALRNLQNMKNENKTE